MYLLIKLISRLFLPSKQHSKNRRGAHFFYRTFKQFQQQQQQQQDRQGPSNNGRDRFEEIEEAEFEDVTDEEKTGAKSSD